MCRRRGIIIQMRKRNNLGTKSRRRIIKNPVSPVEGSPMPFPQLRKIAEVPGVEAVLERARTPYRKRPLSDDEALNLVCDAREDEPHFPIKKLLRKVALSPLFSVRLAPGRDAHFHAAGCRKAT